MLHGCHHQCYLRTKSIFPQLFRLYQSTDTSNTQLYGFRVQLYKHTVSREELVEDISWNVF